MADGAASISVLCVDDEPAVADLVADHLEHADDRLTATAVTSAIDALAYLDDHAVDCIVSDYDMPDVDGIEFLQTVRADDPDCPFILFTARGSESLAGDAIAAGVTDYVQKQTGTEQYRLLAQRISNAVERVRALEQAAETQDRIEAILEAAPDAILVSIDDRVVYANPAAAGLFDVESTDALLDVGVSTLLEPADSMADTSVVELVRDGDRAAASTARTIRTLDGNAIPASVTTREITWHGADAIATIARERIESERRERRLEALHEATRRLMGAEIRNTVAGIGVNAAAEILGLDANSVHLLDDDGGLEPVAATAALRDIVDNIPTFHANDSIDWRVYETCEVTAVPDVGDDPDVYNPSTSIRSELYLPLGEYGILIAASTVPNAFDEQDIAVGRILAANMEAALAAVERDEQLRERERELSVQNERLEQFTSVVSHDLRNPLNVATGRLELVRETCDSEHLDAIERAHDRMQALIDDLLLLARTGESITEREPVALATITEDCWQTVDTADATLAVETDRVVRADPTRLRQLFENLIRNSVEHAGPTVTVTVGDCLGGFYVADDGPGIPEENRDQVFESGYSTAEDGTGFGLSIVKQIAGAHGWDVAVTDATDGGARFEFTGVEFEN
jgi:PAS domain S-box-containing protein